MNWGYKILLVYIVFVAGILLMVIKSASQKVDLVTTDYYAKELKYQERIDANKNASNLSGPVNFKLEKGNLKIYLPKEFEGKNINGNIVLYCPSDENKDVKQDFSQDKTILSLPLTETKKRQFILQVSLQAEGKAYYFEKNIIL